MAPTHPYNCPVIENPLKGLILAAGRGTRLRPLTIARSKPMLPLANRPLIDYPLQKLIDIGVREIGIVVGENEDELRSGLAHVAAALTFIRQPEPLGLAHAVQCAEGFCADSEFILLFCDNLFEASLQGSLEKWRQLRSTQPRCHSLIHTVEVEDPSAFGVAVVEDGWVRELEEKPQQPRSKQAVVGIDFFTQRIFEMIPLIKPSARGELEITDAIAELIRQGEMVAAQQLSGRWFDTGTFPSLIEAHRELAALAAEFRIEGAREGTIVQGALHLPATSSLLNCRINGPVIIGEHCVVRDSELGPCVSIGDNSVVEASRLASCQLYPGTNLGYAQDVDAIYEGALRIDAGS